MYFILQLIRPWFYFALLDSTSHYDSSTSFFFSLPSQYFTLPWLFFTLLKSSMALCHSTWLYTSFYYTLGHSTMALLHSTIVYFSLLWVIFTSVYHGSTLTLRDSTYFTQPWLYLTLLQSTIALLPSTIALLHTTWLYFILVGWSRLKSEVESLSGTSLWP